MDKFLSGRRILIVEDEMLVLMNTEDVLADLGCTSFSAAASIEEALELIDAQFFDAAILDMNLDGHQSYPVADALAARGVPFVFATGYVGRDMRLGYRDRPVLKKPFSSREMIGVLTELLAAELPV